MEIFITKSKCIFEIRRISFHKRIKKTFFRCFWRINLIFYFILNTPYSIFKIIFCE